MEEKDKRLVLSTRDSYHLIEIEDIVYCRSQNTYTTFYLTNGQEIKVSVPIKAVVKKLDPQCFIRPHQSFVVNVNHIRSIQKKTNGVLILDNGEEVAISLRKKPEILQFLEKIVRIQV